MRVKKAKELDIVNYLSNIHYQPVKISGQQYWYYSPLHTEETPSFKVNRSLNRWFDFSEGKGGNLIDLGILIHQCSVKDFLDRLELQNMSLNTIKQQPVSAPKIHPNKIQICSIAAITSGSLIEYLKERYIELQIAEQYVKEVSYEIAGKVYYALGSKNDSGGYELRNKHFKGSSSPKDVTSVKNNASELIVFEGFFNFLSYQKLTQKITSIPADFLILNSTSFFQKCLPKMMTYKKIHLYLDNDNTGQKYTQHALNLHPQKFVDERGFYRGHNDLNEWLISQDSPLSLI